MKLTPEQHTRLLDMLGVVWPQPRICPICRNNEASGTQHEWHTGDSLFQVVTADGIHAHQFVIVSCSNCGYSHFFHAVLLGITDEPKTTIT